MAKKKATRKRGAQRKALEDRVKKAGTTQRANTRRSSKGERWRAPEDMPLDLVELVRAGRACGAKKRSGPGYCRYAPVPGQAEMGRQVPHRCKFHGGLSPGAPKGNKNALKHGVYTTALMDGEEEILARTEVDALDDEIRITKVRLRRALVEERIQREAALEDDPGALEEVMEVRETQDSSEQKGREEGGPDELKIRTSTTRGLRNAEVMVNAIVNQLVKLTQAKAALEGRGLGDSTPEQRAAMARAFLQEAKAAARGG